MRFYLRLILCMASLAFSPLSARSADGPRWIFSCAQDNDLFQILSSSGQKCERHETPAEAIERAPEGSAVLLLADGYPGRTVELSADLFSTARNRKLRLYVEYPSAVPGLTFGKPRTVVWERAVVATDFFGPRLPAMSILSPQNCAFLPFDAPRAHLLLGRVAGYATAPFGLPKQAFPLLAELPQSETNGPVLVASTKLSQMVTARFSPAPSWDTAWRGIFKWLNPEADFHLQWKPTVRPSYAREDRWPRDVEREAMNRGVDWFVKSRLLLHSSRTNEIAKAWAGEGIAPAPNAAAPVGDGSLGLLEGYYSRVQPDGSQLQAVALRGDCSGEGAMALAFGGKVTGDKRYSEISRNILDFYYFTSPAFKKERGDPSHGAYGLSAWGVGSPAWYVANYGDDNARLLLGTLAAAALLEEDRWDESVLRCLLANLRTTGTLGFRGDRIDVPELGQNGWEYYFRRRITNYAPHFESYLWACYLWAYEKTRFELFLDRAKSGIRLTMKAYPDHWRWTNGLQQERARMLLCLAWLVRVEDTPEHRGWLRRMAGELLSRQDESGAVREEIGDLSRGQMHPPQSNEAYGSGESPLLQQNGDPVSDLLYTCNFAFLGLNEAARATGDSYYAEAADKLARFLCRIQVRSDAHPELDGGWYRAFDYRLWDYWASNADAGWGAWSIESGWTQGWITSVLAMREMDTSLWELTSGSKINQHFEKLRREMIPDEALKRSAADKVTHPAIGRKITLEKEPSENYAGGGASGLLDGILGGTDHQDQAWLGFLGNDLIAKIDLGSEMAINQLELSCLQNVRLGIFLPTKVEFFTGNDPGSLRLRATAKPQADPKKEGAFKNSLRVNHLNVVARYIEIRASNLGKIPDWHPVAGRDSWLFADEIILNKPDGR
ncbi:MAG: hypothetical protein ACTHMT_05400 [Verrucomicrobiota bacterium]